MTFRLENSPGVSLTDEELETSRITVRNGDQLEAWKEELDEFWDQMRQFEYKSEDPQWVFIRLSAFSARAGEIRKACVRSSSKRVAGFRTQEIDKFIEECDRQFKIWSRLLTVQTFDWEVSKGGV